MLKLFWSYFVYTIFPLIFISRCFDGVMMYVPRGGKHVCPPSFSPPYKMPQKNGVEMGYYY